MAIELIGTIKPKNNGSFPIVEAVDVKVKDDGTRLDEVLNTIPNIVQVSELPENPDVNTLYLITEESE